jgi:hypothetical protein
MHAEIVARDDAYAQLREYYFVPLTMHQQGEPYGGVYDHGNTFGEGYGLDERVPAGGGNGRSAIRWAISCTSRTLLKTGGRVGARGNRRFPDLQTAQKFYQSDDYSATKKIRHQAADARIIVIDGI